MNDVLTRAACDFEDDTRHRQDVENEIAIAYCRRRVPASSSCTFNVALASLTHALSLQRFLVISV
jgi:hypothetical protein